MWTFLKVKTVKTKHAAYTCLNVSVQKEQLRERGITHGHTPAALDVLNQKDYTVFPINFSLITNDYDGPFILTLFRNDLISFTHLTITHRVSDMGFEGSALRNCSAAGAWHFVRLLFNSSSEYNRLVVWLGMLNLYGKIRQFNLP